MRNESIRKAVETVVFEERRCISLDELLQIKGEKAKNSENRKVMKRWLDRNFVDLVYLNVENNCSQVILSKDAWDEVQTGTKSLNSSIALNEMAIVKDAAAIIRNVIADYIKRAKELPWPPTVESLQDRLKSMPDLLKEFLRLLLSPTCHFFQSLD